MTKRELRKENDRLLELVIERSCEEARIGEKYSKLLETSGKSHRQAIYMIKQRSMQATCIASHWKHGYPIEEVLREVNR